ncbi:MAG: hypothetical protein ACYSYL_00300, partial [Planctomycetota bacterium]
MLDVPQVKQAGRIPELVELVYALMPVSLQLQDVHRCIVHDAYCAACLKTAAVGEVVNALDTPSGGIQVPAELGVQCITGHHAAVAIRFSGSLGQVAAV